MNTNQNNSAVRIALGISLLAAAALGGSNVGPTKKYAWGENIGWTNWRDANATGSGVRVHRSFLDGYIWGENVGWINVGNGGATPPPAGTYANTNNTNFGVNINPTTGECTGYAWGENIGWINFGTTAAVGAQGAKYVTAQARFTGYAWGENVGWINLDNASAFICALVADIDGTGTIDTLDLILLLQKFGQNVAVYTGADFDGSGSINTLDLILLLQQFGKSCP